MIPLPKNKKKINKFADLLEQFCDWDSNKNLSLYTTICRVFEYCLQQTTECPLLWTLRFVISFCRNGLGSGFCLLWERGNLSTNGTIYRLKCISACPLPFLLFRLYRGYSLGAFLFYFPWIQILILFRQLMKAVLYAL